MGNDLRSISAESKAILLNPDGTCASLTRCFVYSSRHMLSIALFQTVGAVRNLTMPVLVQCDTTTAIKIDQDAAGKMGFRINSTKESQTWARALDNGDIAVGLYNKLGGSPPNVSLVESGAYCGGSNWDFGFGEWYHYMTVSKANGQLVGTNEGCCRVCCCVLCTGHTLETCRDAVKANATAGGRCGTEGYFYYSEIYNGQCTCAKDQCTKRSTNGVYSIYKLAPVSQPR